MKVYNLTSSKGNTVPNQFVIESDFGKTFQSYKSIIAFVPVSGRTCQKKNCDISACDVNKTILDEYYYNYSRTTTKYLCQFLDCTNKELYERIKSGTYKLANLNP